MENRIRQGYQLEVSKNLAHRIEGRLVSNCGNSEIELSKNELSTFNRFIVVKGNILNDKKLIVNYSLDDDLFTAKIRKIGKKKTEYTTALVQGDSLVNTLTALNDYLAWYGKDIEHSIDTINASLKKDYSLVLLKDACSFLKADTNHQKLSINRVSERTASIFSMFPNIIKKVSDTDSMMVAVIKEGDKYIIKSRNFLTGDEETSEEFGDLLDGLVTIDRNIERKSKGRKTLCKKHC